MKLRNRIQQQPLSLKYKQTFRKKRYGFFFPIVSFFQFPLGTQASIPPKELTNRRIFMQQTSRSYPQQNGASSDSVSRHASKDNYR
jgi:hypothetical protein